MAEAALKDARNEIKWYQCKHFSGAITLLVKLFTNVDRVVHQQPFIEVHEVIPLKKYVYREERINHVPQNQQRWSFVEWGIFNKVEEAQRYRECVENEAQ